jgi:hypothetical protein
MSARAELRRRQKTFVAGMLEFFRQLVRVLRAGGGPRKRAPSE